MPLEDMAIPQLPAKCRKRTMEFDRRLGPDAEIVSPLPDYAIADRGSLELHFFRHETLVPEESAFGCYLRVKNVDALFDAFSSVGLPSIGIPRLIALEDKPWGMREFAVVDEGGSLIRVGQVL